MRRMGLRRNYQYSCSHVLFGPSCKASKLAARETATVASISGASITLNPGWTSHPHERFSAGMIEWTNSKGDLETRSIMSVSGDTLMIGGMLRDVYVGMTVYPYRGCARTLNGCAEHSNATEASNIHNFGGCPFIPTQNPVGRTSVFY